MIDLEVGQRVLVCPKQPCSKQWQERKYTGEVVNVIENKVYIRNIDASSNLIEYMEYIYLDSDEFDIETV